MSDSYKSHHVSNIVSRLASDFLNSIDHDHIVYYLQTIFAIIDIPSSGDDIMSKIQNNISNDAAHHYITNILKQNEIYKYTFNTQNLYQLVYISEQYFEKFNRQFAKVMNNNLGSMDPNVVNDLNEFLYQALAYYVIGYTVLVYYIPTCLSMVNVNLIKEADMELYGQLISFYKNEFYFNTIRSEIDDYCNFQKNSTNINNDYYFPTIKKRKSTKSYLTDYGPEYYKQEASELDDNNAHKKKPIDEDLDEMVYNIQEVELSTKELPSISSKTLQKYLQATNRSVLLVDLRSRESFNTNHIINKFLINIDPNLLSTNKQDLTEDSLEKVLKKILKSQVPDNSNVNAELDEEEDRDLITVKNTYNYFKQRHKFHLIVYYTDAETWSLFNNERVLFNYLQLFYDLIYKDKPTNASKSRKLTKPPKVLENGFESWLSLLESQNLENLDDEKDASQLSPNDFSNYYVARSEEMFEQKGTLEDMYLSGTYDNNGITNSRPIDNHSESYDTFNNNFNKNNAGNSDGIDPYGMQNNRYTDPSNDSAKDDLIRNNAPRMNPPPIPRKNSMAPNSFDIYNNPPKDIPPPVPLKSPKAVSAPKFVMTQHSVGNDFSNNNDDVSAQQVTQYATVNQRYGGINSKNNSRNNSRNNSPINVHFQQLNHHSHHHNHLLHHNQGRLNNNGGYVNGSNILSPALPSVAAPTNYGEPDQPTFPPPLPPAQKSLTVSPYEASKEQLNNSMGGKRRKPPPDPPALINSNMKIDTFPTLPPILQGSNPIPLVSSQRYQGIQAPQLQPPQQASQIMMAPHRPIAHTRPKQPLPPAQPTQQPLSQHPRKPVNVLKSLSIVGLKNYESNCYINSLLQCIFSVLKFRTVFLAGNYRKYMSDASNNPNIRKPAVSQAIGRLFDKMNTHGGVIIAPTNFLNVCSKIRPDFHIPYQQQDSTEFLIFLLDIIHEELNGSDLIINQYPESIIPALNFGDITDFDTSSRLSINVTDEEIRGYTKWFKKITQKNGVSPVSALFQGQLESCLKCVKCMKVSKTFANFSVLTLSIVAQTYGKKKIRLEDCIKLFTADEILSGDNAWDCPNCKKKDEELKNVNNFYNSVYGESNGDAEAGEPANGSQPQGHQNKTFFNLRGKKKDKLANKKHDELNTGHDEPATNREKFASMQITGNKTIKCLKFIQIPRILVISLSRFKFNKYGEQASKNGASIIFPILLDIKVKDEILTYKLFAFINHFGSLKGGHYTSIVNKQAPGSKRDCWCYFDDENYEVNINPGINYADNTITSSDVYVLFYQKVESVI